MDNRKKILVTGGAGFIGSHLVDYLAGLGYDVVIFDKLTYAGSLDNLKLALKTKKVVFIQGDICNTELVSGLLHDHKIDYIFNLAAETHVDNSIKDANAFIKTNVNGTYSMLNAAYAYWQKRNKFKDFRFLHVSTDEVFGSLSDTDEPFTESTPYAPNSPYSASKASGDHLVRAWWSTYELPIIISHCSNNFGPRQNLEKLIPTVIYNALNNQKIPIYGTGKNIRDWLYVKDHCRGMYLAITKGKLGESYCFGGNNELQNMDVAKLICSMLDRIKPRSDNKSYLDQLGLVDDRKGHDWRYAINFKKASQELGFIPGNDYKKYWHETIKWYIGVKRNDALQNSAMIEVTSINEYCLRN
ncbi:MAG: dTDP-glucose 4,6-dehydratase [Rickettsiales bacterium]|nr:dTDP-glucose 4,6-dehydratase [Rickettsiales bacterium]